MSYIPGEDFAKSESTASGAPKNGSSAKPPASGLGSTSVARKATGPRTQQGKERSKHNAVKHGIFSKVAVVNGESRADFDALLNGLRNDLQPVGTLEELLVEKLATLFWRNRRLLIAEDAEIRAGSEFVDWDGQERQRQEFAGLPSELLFNSGLMLCIANPHAAQGCLSFLDELEDGILTRGFAPELDAVILTKLYGRDHQENGKPTLFSSYLRCAAFSTRPEEGRKEKGLPSNQKIKEIFLAELRKVVTRLGCHEKELARILDRKLKLESLRQNVPGAPQMDRLLRYETSLERSIERTLNQLERVQRMRLGRPAPHSISLNINS